MDEQQLQEQIVQLVQDAMQGNQEATQKIQQIMQAAQQGDQQAVQLAQMIQQVAQQMQQVQSAKFGAKLNYVKQLKGKCPIGYEMRYYKVGGKLCSECIKEEKESKKPLNTIDAFKCGRKMKKKACGGPVKKYQKGEAVKPVKTVKTVITYPNQLEGQVRRVQYFDDGTQAVLNGGWGTDGMYYQTLRGRQGEFGDIYGTPRQRQIADSLKRVDWKDYGTGPVYVPALKKKSRTK